MTTMRAAVITKPGSPKVLTIESRPIPVPGRAEILVRVVTSALNRADLIQRDGRYPAPPGAPPDIPGIEFAGEVTAVGEHVTLWKAGDRVCGLVGGGAHAEFLVTHERAVAALPVSIDWLAAGACAEAFITAHDALVSQALLRPGDAVLVHAVGSGVGLAAIQLATAIGARVFGTARSNEKLTAAKRAGMIDGLIPDSADSIVEGARRWTDGRGVDVVLDLVGGDYTANSIGALAPRGRLMVVGTLAGNSATINLGHVLSRRLQIRGTVLRSRPIEERILVTQAFAREVMPLLASGQIAPVIHETFPLSRIREAHELLASNATIGKVALVIDEGRAALRTAWASAT